MDITDDLSDVQLAELDEALLEADKQDGISWNDFKQEMKEWKEK